MPKPDPHARAPKLTPGHPPPTSHSIPAEIDAVFLKLKPNAPPEERQEFFNRMVIVYGGYHEAVENLRGSADGWNSGARLGPPTPPDNAVLIPVFGVGPFTVFYHSGIPAHMQRGILNGAPFFWNFYIANGPDKSLIMTDWETRNITVRVMGHTLTWEPCTLLSVSPSARVRISWPSGPYGEILTRELIFPSDPNAPQEHPAFLSQNLRFGHRQLNLSKRKADYYALTADNITTGEQVFFFIACEYHKNSTKANPHHVTNVCELGDGGFDSKEGYKMKVDNKLQYGQKNAEGELRRLP
ncbi:hypothetical protein K438DRAFT_1994682 [Mycena galopus ATCC 62051]|nr:hypothetical protein K438DRAFT_1994682 [Mycena galopus ATCC 62051]